jgi:hypothetical protein
VSTYYYLLCEQHKVSSHVIGGRAFPDRWYSTSRGELEQFLADHADCKPNPILVNEHDDRVDDWDRYPYPEEVFAPLAREATANMAQSVKDTLAHEEPAPDEDYWLHVEEMRKASRPSHEGGGDAA